MARIITISKFPPLEGGIAARTYWLAKALGEKGHNIHVVTDRIGVDPLYSIKDYPSDPVLKNVLIHRASSEGPWTIPSVEQTSIALLNKGLEVIDQHKVDLIEGSYLVPYGVVAWMLSNISGLPLVLRHGGSDIGKYIKTGVWSQLWKKIFSAAELVISDCENVSTIRELAKNVEVLTPYMPDPRFFTASDRKKNNKPVVALIGKSNYHWQYKGWHKAIEILAGLNKDFDCWIVSQGRGYQDFRNYVENKIGDSVMWYEFVSPWQMPDILRKVDALFCLEEGFPFPMFSNIAVEALCCGTRLITDRSDTVRYYTRFGLNLMSTQNSILFLSTPNSSESAAMVKKFILKGIGTPKQSISDADYLSYIEKNEKAILSLC